MEYTRDIVEQLLYGEDAIGEVMFVLESDREYELHSGNVELKTDHLVAEGLKDGEYITVWIPYARIEHHFTHKAL